MGGITPGERNLISGNRAAGIYLSGFSGGVVQGNWIGLDATGSSSLPNGEGINVTAGRGFIMGGADPGAGNVISGNGGTGIKLTASSVRNVQIKGNAIGTDGSGTLPVGNAGYGIEIVSGSGTVIGDEAPNIIAWNGFSGVVGSTVDAVNNAILANRIFGNTYGGITFGVGGENDPCDTDMGPNRVQNSPELASAVRLDNQVTVTGALDSTAETMFRLDFFANSTCNTDQAGQGEYFLGSSTVTTDGGCTASFTVTPAIPPEWPSPAVVQLTATATDPDGNTSRFSRCQEVSGTGIETDPHGDGLPTDWEESYGLSPEDATGDNGAEGDPDRDGSVNLAEFQAGTRPNDDRSVLRITDLNLEGQDVRITWTTAGGRTNQLQTASAAPGDGPAGEFTDVGPEIIMPGARDLSTNAVHSEGLSGSAIRYYRVRLVH